eukprot:GFUD01001661.1.p1 GENE.GFUD01001661.1~~GFUD01001661.1.p1  ORF type:complete len:1153 (-),score=202.90 GFUD01001661.1:50-3508(-)
MDEKNLKRLCSLSEDEVMERYERNPSAPIAEENSHSEHVDIHASNEKAKLKLMEQSKLMLDIEEPHKDGLRLRKSVEAGEIQTNDSDSDDDDDNTDKTVNPPADDDDYQRPAKLDLIVGFLRLFNFVSCCTSVFAVILSIIYPISQTEPTLQSIWAPLDVSAEEFYRTKRDTSSVLDHQRGFLFYLKGFAGLIQLSYLFVTTVFVIIDSVATVTFRWKEYGELTHRHTDATSIIFLISKSRWKMRFLTCLTIASAASLQTTQIILNYYGRSLELARSETGSLIFPNEVPQHAFHAVIWYLSLMGAGILSFVVGYALHLIPASWRDVPWLDNILTDKHIDDKGDRWKSTKDILGHIGNSDDLTSIDSSSPKKCSKGNLEKKELFYKTTYKQLTCFGYILESLKKITYFISYVCAIAMNLRAILLMELSIHSFEFWTCIISTSCTTLISLYLVILVCIQCFKLPPKPTPFLSQVYVPFVLSSGLRLLLDLRKDSYGQYFFAYVYVILIFTFLFLQIFSIFTKTMSRKEPFNFWFFKFLSFNFYKSEGAYKKVVRLFDTLGSFFGLVGLILGLFSLLMDQYDLEFEAEGELKDVADGLKAFGEGVKSVADGVKEIIKAFDFNVTCEVIYSTLAGGSVAAFVLSIIPGAGAAANIGSRSAYYTVKAGSSLGKLASMLKNSAKNLWKVANVIFKISKFTVGNFKKFTIGGSSMTMLRLLPFIPPVVVGIHILFSAFWPKRVLFFHSSQRRKFIDGQFSHWFLILVLLILALTINTALVDEIQNAFNESLPLLNVHVQKKFGWQMSLAASAFSIASALSYIIAYYTLKQKTDKDHENITNEEKEWRNFVDSKKKCTYKNAFGPKIEWKNQIKYKKEVIGPWNWVLPITLCLIACGFGVAANLYPKIDMHREPKGAFGRVLDKIFSKMALYEDDMRRVKEYGEQECLPFATFNDVLKENMDKRANILMNPINHFFNKTEELMRPLKEIISRTRKQFIADIGDDLFGEDVAQSIKDFKKLDLQYIGMLLLIPRAINLFILIFGMITMCCAVKDMSIVPSREPRKIVDAFGTVCIFSVIFVLGAQLSVFNILSDFGVPFYRITTRLGLGFMYDMVCDSIMVSVWIGMKNEFFFTIPRRKVTVSYSVPGVSDQGPNPQNRIL